jgi:4'-phosphopantetheinyl transferase
MIYTPHRIAAPPPFEAWIWTPDASGPSPGADAAQWLDEHERARAGRYRFERDRRRYIDAHAVLRLLLSARIGVAPERVAFEIDESGKPRLHPAGCAFSMSRSEDLVLVAMADAGEIGADVERLRSLPDLDALAERCLTPAERAALAALPPAERDLAFMRAWTRKEACLKALGTGLRIEPSTFDAGLHAVDGAVRIDTPQGAAALFVQSLPDGADWVGAVARVVSS